ncbi:MAG TPA: Hpt domain-containing protein [Usitatibacter sp.]|nr:Hpt domain-containing protein [Usitatibacter sp.]
MAANQAATDFDLGPLTWVKTEIDHSLNQARENLDKLLAAPADRAPVKYILTHLHQATGALAMVNLGAATRFNEELEKLVAFLEKDDASQLPGAIAVAKKGISALSTYLDALIAGQPDQPLRLLAPFIELNRARGASDANEGDLFFPNLAAELPALPAGEKLDDAVLAKALAHQRSLYQQGLLRMLKGADAAESLRSMHGAVLAIESLQAATPNRPFWTAAAGFFDALVFAGIEHNGTAKPLFAKLDQQVKQTIDGSPKVAERLFRDLLLAVARSRPVSERVVMLKDAFRLENLVALPERGLHAVEDDEQLTSLVREVREVTAQQKDTWLKYTSGNRAALDPFGKHAVVLSERAGRLPNRDIHAVLYALTEVAPALRAKNIPPTEAQSLEVATALLFIESALENYSRLGADFARQAGTVQARLKSALAGEALPPMDVIEGGLLDEMTRRAQEKLLIFQVGQEVQVNLQNIEQALDAFFRDNAKRAELATLPAQFAQVQGALMIMELHDAASLNAAVMLRVQQFTEGSLDGSGDAADMVADGLSALGLYISALQQGSASAKETLVPALLRFGLLQPEPIGIESVVRRSHTVSPGDIELQKQKVQALYEDWKGAPAETTRAKLEKSLDELKRDAAVVADSAVTQQSEAALQAMQENMDPQQSGLFRAITQLAPEKAPEEPAAQVVQLVDAPGAEVDKELLDIFLEEAVEVVGTIGENLATCRDAPHDREALTTIRRGFHTLKGSGRMVGLNELGEIAWQCEQVLNKWLKDENPATAPLLGFIELARNSFSGWVGELKQSATARIDGADITRQAEALKSGEAPAAVEAPAAIAEVVAAAAEPAAIVEAPATPVIELAPAAEAAEPVEAVQPAAEISFDSLDFAAAPAQPQVAAESAELSFDVEPAPAQVTQPAAPEVAELASPEIAGLAAPEPISEAQPLDDTIAIGEVTVSRALFSIYLGEAEQHIASMEREMSALEADTLRPVSPDFMRAAHTLASTSRTTGFVGIADLAHALEKWLQEAIDLPPEFDAGRLGGTRRAVDALGAMVQSVRGQALPHDRNEVVEVIEALREGLRQSRRTGEGTHLRMPGHVTEETPMGVDAAPQVEEPVPVVAIEPAPVVAIAPPPVPVVAIEPATAAAAEPVAPQFEAGKDQRKIKDDVDRDLLPVFLEEAREIIPLVSESVRRWKSNPGEHAPAADLHRHLHTLKGSARMAGLMRLGELAHVLEARVIAQDAVAKPDAKAFEEIEERVDRFSLSLERLARGEDIIEAEPVQVPVAAVFEHRKDKPGAMAVMAAAAQEVASRDAVPAEMRESRAALLRVNAEMIDRFVNEAGELSIARSRIELEMATFRRSLVDLTDNINRMRAQLREIEIAAESQMQSTLKAKEEHGDSFDPLEMDRFSRMQELTRFLAESLGDVITLHQGLQKNLDETELAIHAQARLNRELQQGLMGVRLVPLGNLGDRFYRIVRQTAKELDKKANLELKGTRVELDRSVLEKITAPFEHLLRNAIAHGLEKPGDRLAAGKAEIGEIQIDAVQRGNEVVLSVSDDGAGLNFPRIREKAIASGILQPDVELPESQLAQFIFMTGFSTATEVSQVSGRGVGLDVVKNEITSLGGRVEITSHAGRGTTFTITLPLTLAVTQAVMVRAGQTIHAIPSVMIEQVQEFKAQPYAEVLAKGEIAWKENRYALRSLLPLLGEADTPTPARQIPVLLLKSGVQRAAIRVDEIIGNREVVVKTIGPQLARLAGISGATVLGNGQVVLILNPVQLVHREGAVAPQITVATQATPQPAPVAAAQPVRTSTRVVMVVDDSLTVRKITGRMLAREGYEFVTAKDGVDALQQLQDVTPDCILLDVEMPRMDGFEFTRNVRADAGTRAIPIIMITSRTADKHRNHAIELGVNEYMGKPYQEDQLLALIKRYTSAKSAVPA